MKGYKLQRLAVLVTIGLLSFAICTNAYAGYGECKKCYCYAYSDRGDLLCECGHGYGMHRV